MSEETSRLKDAYEERVRAMAREIEHLERELAILAQVAARVHGAEDVQEILDIALQEILERLNLQSAWILTGDQREKKLHLAASRGVSPNYLERVEREGLEECLCPEVFWTGHRMQARNTTQCPRMPDIIEGLASPVAHACIPLKFEGTTKGVLNVAARPGEHFSDEELRFLETLGHQIGLAVERARHREAERRRNQEARALAAINRAIGGSLDVGAVLRAVGETAGEVLGAEQVYALLGSDPRQVTVAYVSGVMPERIEMEVGKVLDLVAMGWNLSVAALAQRRLMRVSDIAKDAQANQLEAKRLGVAAVIVTPLTAGDRVLGVLLMTRPKTHNWTDEEVDVAEALAAQASLALENARLYETARAAYEAERMRNQEARAMAAISKAVGGSLDVEAVLHAVGDTARDILGVERVAISLGADPRNLRVAHLSGLPHPELVEGQLLDIVAAGAKLQIKALEERRVFCIDDWRSDPRVNHELARRWDAASGVIVPLLARERILGLLVLTRTAPHHWTEDQVEMAEALAAQASVALENARLYQDAREAYQELKDAQDRIIQSEKMAVLGTFASGLAHEVRNPLNSIGLQLALLERRIARIDLQVGEELVEISNVIREEVRRLDGLVGDFLLFSRADRVQHGSTDVDILVEEVLRLLEPEAQAEGVTLRLKSCGEALPKLRVDAEKMKQVVINLVRNAIEAMPEGGEVIVESGVVDGQARLAVRDTGPGLPEGLDVFQLFVTTKPRGTGLGLSIVQQIVLQHGGEITATSEPGRGASFIVTLPIVSEVTSGEGVGR